MRFVRVAASGLAVAVCLSLVTGQAQALAAPAKRAHPLAHDPSVPVHPARLRSTAPAPKDVLRGAARVSWPAAGSAVVSLSGVAPAVVGTLPVRVGPASGRRGAAPARVRVEVADQASAARAGVAGMLVHLSRADGVTASGRVSVGLDYSGFRGAFGGDWAERLRLERLPDCALSTPARAECRPAVVPSSNDVRAARVTADIDVSGSESTFALTSGPSGSTGDFTATSLTPSATWQVNLQSGDFSWSYPLRVPPTPGGLGPDLALSYSSGAVDGRTASTNSQPSWVGEGWDVGSAFIERRYKSCADDGVQTGDLCWGPESLTLSGPGLSSELVRDDATGQYHPRDDDGSKIEHLTVRASNSSTQEYWRVTTIDGTQYYYGLNWLPGWVSGKAATNSAWTVPVFGNNTGEPCHQSTFDASACSQVWRWNLDYVVDPHGDAMAYYYKTETNNYGEDLNKRGASYVRGGTLDKAVYGFGDGHAYDTTPPAQVVFGIAERCVTPGTGCTPTAANAGNYPDAPLDQVCTGSPCTTSQVSPTFWSTKKLTTVTTQIWKGTAYSNVDQWALSQSFPNPGDGTSAALWLDSIAHTGLVGGSVALPPVTFERNISPMSNRVDGLEGWPPMNKYRVGTIRTETGGQIGINYVATCDRSALPSAQDTNTQPCFPQWWTPPAEGAQLDWFHKYVVVQTLENDGIAGDDTTETDYSYQGGGAWHYTDADELTPVAKRTWSQWRGYSKIVVTKGAPGDTRSQSTYLYMRGMNGDKTSTGTRSASVTDSEGHALPDDPWLAGFLREQVTLDGPGGTEVSGQVNDPWHSAATATRTHDGLTVSAYVTRIGSEHTRTTLASGGVRRTQLDRDFDAHGQVTKVDDHGDTSTTADDLCTRTTYASNSSRWMLSYPSEVTSVGVNCDATPTYPDDAISDTRDYYDTSGTLGAIPGGGDVTRTDQVKSYTGGTPNFVTVTSGTYDQYGRALTSSDALTRTTSTVYTDTAGLTTKRVVTDPAGFATTTNLEPAWDQPTTTTDANNKTTELAYDPLGRVSGVWKPSQPRSGNPDATIQFTYTVKAGTPAAVTATALGPNRYTSSYTIYDGLMRPRQTQAPGADGSGRVLTETLYDTRGLPFVDNGPYFNDQGGPGTTLVSPDPNDVTTQTVTTYDGAERPTVSAFTSKGVEQWHSTTSYGGDRVSVTPPQGGTATTTISDARGRTTRLLQYHGPTPTGPADTTTYSYTDADQLAAVTDAVGNVWRYTYDLLGRQTKVEDSDKGTSIMTYDDADQLQTSTDARNRTLAYTYDALGRRTGEYDGSTSGTQLAKWTYDTKRKGYFTSSTRFVDGNAYTVGVHSYDDDGQVLGTDITIPTSETGLTGTYTDQTTYFSDGSIREYVPASTPGLPVDAMLYTYNDQGLPVTGKGVLTDTANLVTAAKYTERGKPAEFDLVSGTTKAFLTYDYEQSTQRMLRASLELGAVTNQASDTTYKYDPAGNVTKVTDNVQGAQAETQCYAHDYLQRLTDAWTPTDDCAGAPGTAPLAGPAPYWDSYSYDLTGNRLQETQHDPAGGTDDTTRQYTYPNPGQPHPHAAQTVTTTSGGVSATSAYGYDPDGNTIGRAHDSNEQTLDWDAEGNLASVTENGQATSFVYDADGNRLIRRDATGATLFLQGGEELHVDTAGVKSSTRYFTFDGLTVAMRTAAGVFFLDADQNNTVTQTVSASDATVTPRWMDPFGNPRGPQPSSWPSDRGFVGGVVDPTGLTHLGAREYDPLAGRFVSVDPVADTGDPQQLNGYAYADNSPVTMTDPSGTTPCSMLPVEDRHGCEGPGEQHGSSGGGGGHHNGASGGGHHSGESTDSGPTDQEQADAAGVSVDDLNKARAVHKKKIFDVVLSITTKLLEDYIGVDDAMDCFLKGHLGACASLLINAVPWYKAYKLAGFVKHLYKAYKAFQKFMKERKWANKVLTAAEDAEGAVCRIGPSSFLPGTLVLMADGSHKPIEKIKPGDKVAATDPVTGKTTARTVVAKLASTGAKHLVQVTITTGTPGHTHTGTVTSTDIHPFWVTDPHPHQGPNLANGHWTYAENLHPGDHLHTPDNQPAVVTTTFAYTLTNQTVHNLTIDLDHTYYVLAGEAPVFVHNCDISMDEAVNRAVLHVGDNATVVRSGSGGVQFMSVTTDESGNAVRKIARFDVNPNSAHVQKLGPHLNLETQINGRTVTSGPLKDPHTGIDPSTIRPGDYWP